MASPPRPGRVPPKRALPLCPLVKTRYRRASTVQAYSERRGVVAVTCTLDIPLSGRGDPQKEGSGGDGKGDPVAAVAGAT